MSDYLYGDEILTHALLGVALAFLILLLVVVAVSVDTAQAKVCDVDRVMTLANEAAHLAGQNLGGMLSEREYRAAAVVVFGALRAELNACGYRVNGRGELVGPEGK